jgi:hypothetical protein
MMRTMDVVGMGCSCCGCAIPVGALFLDCADCGAIFCEDCVNDGSFDNHCCEDDEEYDD